MIEQFRRRLPYLVAPILLLLVHVATAVAQPASVIVRIRAGGSLKEISERLATIASLDASAIRTRRALASRSSALHAAHRLDRYHIVVLDATAGPIDVEAIAGRLALEPDVELAVPNRTYRLHAPASNEPLAHEQWALRRIEAEGAWERTRGADSIVIGFIDTGIDFTHPEFARTLWINRAEDRNGNGRLDPWASREARGGVQGDFDGVDADGNGVVDDVIGYDFVDQTVPNVGDWSGRDGDPGDEVGHGTTVAGVMAADDDNDEGIAGLAPASPLMTLRAFDGTGNGEDDDIAAAIVYAADNGVRVLNMSFGDIFYSPLMHDALRYAHARGVVLVASSGNEGSGEPHYPSSYPEVMSVGMTDSNDLRNELSNFGSQLSVVAPGVEVLSTAVDSSYRLAGGTSIAAPHVSALAALVASLHPTWTPDEIRGVIELTADDRVPFGWEPYYGAGRINARRAAEMDGPVLVAIASPASETGVGADTTLSIVGSAHSPFLDSWQLYVGIGNIPDTGAWRVLGEPQREGRVHAVLGALSTAGLPDTVLTVRLVLRQTNGRTAERRARVLLDRTAPRVLSHEVRPVWRYDERAVGITVATDDRTRLTAMLRRSGSAEPYRAASLEAARTGLVRTHHLVLGPADIPRGVAFDLYVVAENAAGDTASIGSAASPLAIARVDESMPQRGFDARPYELPYGFLLNRTVAIYGPDDRSIAINRFDDGRFGKLVVYSATPGGFVARDSLAEDWLPKDFGDTDGDGLLELLAQSGAATRIFEQAEPDGSVLATTLFDDASAGDATLERTLGATLADVDGDGRDELIGRTDSRAPVVIDGQTLPPHYFIAKNEAGGFRVVARLFNETRPGFGSRDNHYGVPVAVVADVDGDGDVEILVGDDDADFLLYGRDGAGRWTTVWTEENDGKGASELIVDGDFDADGRVEVAMGYRSELTVPNDAGDYESPFWSIRVRRFDGPDYAPSLLLDDRVAYVRRTDPFRSGASAGDLDGRPGDELALSIFPGMYVLRWEAGRFAPLWWKYPSLNNQPIIADIDGDGLAELGVGDGQAVGFHQLDRATHGPGVPGGLVGWATSDSSAHIEWSPVADAQEYNVFRGFVADIDDVLTFELVATVTTTRFDDDGASLPAGRLSAGARYAYAVTALSTATSPSEGDFALPVVVLVHALARPLSARAAVDSSIELALSVDVDEELYRQGAFDATSVVDGRSVAISSVTVAATRRVILHIAEARSGDSLAIRLTRMFRDALGAPGDTTVAVGVRLPPAEVPGERFIATRAERAGRRSSGGGATIRIRFNAPVDPESATVIANYTLRPNDESIEREVDEPDGAIVGVQVDPDDPAAVILELAPGYPIGPLGRNYTITIREVLAADGREVNDGAGSVVGLTLEAEDVSAPVVYPQPFSLSADERVTIGGLPRDARVVIVTTGGRLVRELRETEHNGGVDWDGRDAVGMAVPSGVYLYRVTMRVGATTVESELGKIAVVP